MSFICARLGVVICLVAGACAHGETAGGPVRNEAPVVDAASLAKRADALFTASVALDYERPFRGKPLDLAPVIAAYLEACRAGDGRSCRRAAALAPQEEEGGAGLRALVELCRSGQLESCRSIPATGAIAEDHALRGWAGRAQACKDRGCDDELRRECSDGFALSCYVLGLHDDVADDDALFERARALVRAGCRADIGPDCELLGLLRETDDDGVLYDGYSCRLRGVRCVNYGLDVRDDPIAGRDVFERYCQYSQTDQLNACRVLVEVYADRHLPEPVPGRARAVRDWLCAQPGADRALCARR